MEIEILDCEPLPPPPKKIVITLDEDEAAALFVVCGKISGSPSSHEPNLRYLTDSLWTSLNDKLDFFTDGHYTPIAKKYANTIIRGMEIG